MAIPFGNEPVRTVCVSRLVRASMTETLPDWLLVTKSVASD